MNFWLAVVIISVGIMAGIAFLLFFIWMVIDRYMLRRLYYRVMILLKTGGWTLVWAKKTDEHTPDGKYNIARVGRDAYMYQPQHIRSIAGYQGFVAYQNTFMALDFDMRKLEFDSKTTIHPNILNEFLNTKLIAELLEKKTPLELILLIIAIALIVIGMLYLVNQHNKQTEILMAIKDMLASSQQVTGMLT